MTQECSGTRNGTRTGRAAPPWSIWLMLIRPPSTVAIPHWQAHAHFRPRKKSFGSGRELGVGPQVYWYKARLPKEGFSTLWPTDLCHSNFIGLLLRQAAEKEGGIKWQPSVL